MAVLIGRNRRELARLRLHAQLRQSVQQGRELLIGEQTRSVQFARVRARGREVVQGQPPVEVNRTRDARECLGWRALEPPAPKSHPSLLTCPSRFARPITGPVGQARHAEFRTVRRAAILVGSPQSSTKPRASDWSKVSPES